MLLCTLPAVYRNGADTARPPLLSDTPPPLERVPILALYESNANGGTLTTFTGSGASAPFSVVLRDVLEDDMVLLSWPVRARAVRTWCAHDMGGIRWMARRFVA